MSIRFGSARISQSSKPQLPSPPRVSIVAEQPRTFRDGFQDRSDLRSSAATKRKHRRRRRARHSSTQGAREIDGAVDSRCLPPQPFREADPSGAGFVPPRRDPRRDLPGGSFAGCESTGRGGGESEAVLGRPRKMQAGVMHPSASTQDLIRATRPKFPEGLKVRRTTRIAPRSDAPPVFRAAPDRGYLTQLPAQRWRFHPTDGFTPTARDNQF